MNNGNLFPPAGLNTPSNHTQSHVDLRLSQKRAMGSFPSIDKNNLQASEAVTLNWIGFRSLAGSNGQDH